MGILQDLFGDKKETVHQNRLPTYQERWLRDQANKAMVLSKNPLDYQTQERLAGLKRSNYAHKLGDLTDNNSIIARTARGEYFNTDRSKDNLRESYKPFVEAYNQAVADTNDSAYQSGRYGSGAYARIRNNQDEALGQQMERVTRNVYNDERNREQQAVGQLANLYQQQYGALQGQAQDAMQYDKNNIALQRMGQARPFLTSNFGSMQNIYRQNPFVTGLGVLSKGLGMYGQFKGLQTTEGAK